MSGPRSVIRFAKGAAAALLSIVAVDAQAQTAQRVDGVDLIAAQKAGGAAAAAYNGKSIELFNVRVNGFFAMNTSMRRLNPALDLRTPKSFDYVACEMSLQDVPEIAKLAIGQTLVVTGVAAVGTYSLRLNGCKIVKLLDPVLPATVSPALSGDTVSANSILTDYLKNSVAATQKYKGKALKISGRISSATVDKLKLRANEFNSVTCPLPSPVIAFLQNLPSGTEAVVSATVDEMDSVDLNVKNCSLITPTMPAIPTSAPAPTPAPTPAPAATTPAATTAPAASSPTAPVTAPASPTTTVPGTPAKPAAAAKFKTADLKTYYPTAVHADGSWTMTGVAGENMVRVRQDEKDGSPTRGKFFIAIAGGTERLMYKTELRAFYDGLLVRAKAPGAAPFEKEAVQALAAALGLKPVKLP